MYRKGFTIVELLVVIVIIGVFGAFSISQFVGASDSATLAKVRTELSQIRSGAAIYFEREGTYRGLCDADFVRDTVANRKFLQKLYDRKERIDNPATLPDGAKILSYRFSGEPQFLLLCVEKNTYWYIKIAFPEKFDPFKTQVVDDTNKRYTLCINSENVFNEISSIGIPTIEYSNPKGKRDSCDI